MKYKEGDRVRIRSKEWYESNKNKFGKVWTRSLTGDCMICFDHEFVKYCGKVAEIFSVERDNYALKGIPYAWTDEMIEGLAEEEEIEFTEEDKYWCDIMSESDPTTYVLPQGYQFKDENGNVINATKIVLEKKKKEYPKTYEECCKVLGYSGNYNMTLTTDVDNKLFDALYRLKVCRDAYWKIAGEEMGLGKPWKPIWDYNQPDKYILINIRNSIHKDYRSLESAILAFPTEEMRDAFKENFDPDIEICKELL